MDILAEERRHQTILLCQPEGNTMDIQKNKDHFKEVFKKMISEKEDELSVLREALDHITGKTEEQQTPVPELTPKQKLRDWYVNFPCKRNNYLVFAIDVSGSITDNLIGKSERMIESLCRNIQVKGMIVYFSNEVEKVEIYEVFPKQIKLSTDLKREGTDIQSVFDYLNDKWKDEIAGLVCFTDLEFPLYTNDNPEYPVLWITKNNDIMPAFGEKLVY